MTELGDKRIEMLHGQRKWAVTTNDRSGRQMNRIAVWPADKGGHQRRHKGRTHLEKELRTPNSKLFGEIYTWCESGHHIQPLGYQFLSQEL